MTIYKGNAASDGIAVGKVHVYIPVNLETAERFISKEDVAGEIDAYKRAVEKADTELRKLQGSLAENHPDKAKIFKAHCDLIHDEEIEQSIRSAITNDLFGSEWAIETAYSAYAQALSQIQDPLIKERAADLIDVKKRLLRICRGLPENDLSHLDGPCVMVLEDLLPSDSARLDRKNVLGIITEKGGATSHSAIITRSYGIPALLGVKDALKNLHEDMPVIIDATNIQMIAEPNSGQIEAYLNKKAQLEQEVADEARNQARECKTADGVKIQIGMNLARPSVEELSALATVDYVGLFRTEFMYMNAISFPSEEEQFERYKALVTAVNGKPVTLRTLDIGGDKTLSYYELPKETNPFLGIRALRLCLAHPDIFRTQLRAALRASVFGKIDLMFPMVGSIDDMRAAKQTLEQVKAELWLEGKPFDENIKVGIMIEIPSIALISDVVVKYVDFASIGTNDLCQYLTAADRQNPETGPYYQVFHPALFRTIRFVVEQFNKAGKPISVCGEMGGNPLAASVLVGMGMRKLSMGFAMVAKIKKTISKHTISELEEIAGKAAELPTAEAIEEYLRSVI
jgi:phosphotransferase system enzyme I (PtsI)